MPTPTTRFHRWRLQQGMSLRQLEKATKLFYSQIGLIEAGQRPCRPSRRALLARRLGVEPADLFDPGPATELAEKLLRLLSLQELELLDAHTLGGANVKGWKQQQAVTS